MLALILLSGSLMTPTSPAVHAQTSSAPYLYYYSDVLHAFIVERADGTDSHVLAEGVMPPLHEGADGVEIDGPGWSPSGQWFGWSLAEESRDNLLSVAPIPYLINLDGRRFDLPAGLTNFALAWSPQEDILAVAAHWFSQAGTSGTFHTYFALIDPNTSQSVVLVEENQPADFSPLDPFASPPAITWTADGQHAIIYYNERSNDPNADPSRTHLLILNREGTTTALNRPFWPLLDSWWISTAWVSAQGYVFYRENDAFVLENLISGERQTVEASPDERWEIYWSPAGNHALLVESDGMAYHLNPADAALTPLAQIDGSVTGETGWYWLDDQHVVIATLTDEATAEHTITTFDLASGTQTSVSATVPQSRFFRLSPAGDALAFINVGPTIVDLQTGTALEARPDADSYFSIDGGEVVWSADGEWLITQDEALLAGGGYPRHLGVIGRDGTGQRDLSYVLRGTPYAIDWLPAQVDPSVLPLLTSPLAPTPVHIASLNYWIPYVSWSPDSTQLAVTTGNLFNDGERWPLWQWDVAADEMRPLSTDMTNTDYVAWETDAAGVATPTVLPREVTTLPSGELLLSDPSPDGRYLVVNADLPKVITVETGEAVATLSGGRGAVMSASFSPDGRWLAVGSPYDDLKIWDTTTWQVVVQLHSASPAVAFSPDGQWLAASYAWDVHIYAVSDLMQQ